MLGHKEDPKGSEIPEKIYSVLEELSLFLMHDRGQKTWVKVMFRLLHLESVVYTCYSFAGLTLMFQSDC